MSLIKPLLATIAAAMFTGSLFFAEIYRQQTTNPTQVLGSSAELSVFSVSQVVDYGDGRTTNFAAQANRGDSALKLLQLSQLPLETKSYSFGVAVETINDVKNGIGGKFWIYYINGVSATVGADQYQLKPGDIITWKFESAQ